MRSSWCDFVTAETCGQQLCAVCSLTVLRAAKAPQWNKSVEDGSNGMTMISANGIAHIQLTVRDVAASRPFYHRLLVESFGMSIQYDLPTQVFYCIGARTGVLIRPAAPEHRDTPFDQWRIGLHHFCFRLRSRADVDALHTSMRNFGARIVRAPQEDSWAPGYYSVLFEDPDGIRIEANFVPGSGNLDRIKDGPLSPIG
jgi:catechol 2,3-dioxygenase-like lactoylglutathione lyase family enzyme